MARRFVRTAEDFVCSVCRAAVCGDGYTNHCPACLWSRHVDVNPGDRASGCGGMMKPVAVEAKSDGVVLTHVCVECGHSRRNRGAASDDGAAVIALAAAVANAALVAQRAEPPDADGGGLWPSRRMPRRRPVRDTGRGSGAPRRPDRRR